MIFHASVPAADPERVAGVLAELLDGKVTPFGQRGFMAWSGHHAGHMIEVLSTEPPALADRGPGRSLYDAVHFAMGVEKTPEEVIALGRREGWRTRRCRRGGSFDVIEFWLEDHFLIEVLTPEMQREYLAALGGA